MIELEKTKQCSLFLIYFLNKKAGDVEVTQHRHDTTASWCSVSDDSRCRYTSSSFPGSLLSPLKNIHTSDLWKWTENTVGKSHSARDVWDFYLAEARKPSYWNPPLLSWRACLVESNRKGLSGAIRMLITVYAIVKVSYLHNWRRKKIDIHILGFCVLLFWVNNQHVPWCRIVDINTCT